MSNSGSRHLNRSGPQAVGVPLNAPASAAASAPASGRQTQPANGVPPNNLQSHAQQRQGLGDEMLSKIYEDFAKCIMEVILSGEGHIPSRIIHLIRELEQVTGISIPEIVRIADRIFTELPARIRDNARAGRYSRS